MLNQFSRTQLMFGKENIEKLHNSHIAIFGIGGVGGYSVEALVRSGIGEITLIDDDKVCLTNLNRQLYATLSTVGKYKVDVAKDRILDINKKAKVNTFKTFYTPETKYMFDFSKYDYVIDAIDTVVGKLSIVEECYKANTPVISSMGAGNKVDPTMFEVDDIYNTSVCPLARVMRQQLKKRKIPKLKVVYSKEKPLRPLEDMSANCKTNSICPQETAHKFTKAIPSSNAFVPSVVGLIIAGEVIKDLIDYRQVEI